MKWGTHNEKAEQRVNAVFVKLIGNRAFYVLLAMASLILAAGAHNKFGG